MLNWETLGACIWVEGEEGEESEESEVGWAETWLVGSIVAGGSDCGFQFYPCLGEHMRSKHPVERKSHARVASQRDTAPPTCHQTGLVPRTRGMPCTISVQSAHPRSSRLDVLSEDEPGQETEQETAVAVT